MLRNGLEVETNTTISNLISTNWQESKAGTGSTQWHNNSVPRQMEADASFDHGRNLMPGEASRAEKYTYISR